jgi:CheY-like chemotaxis protein
MTRPRVLLADDHGPMLARVVELVAAEFDVVAAVSDGQSAVDAAAVLQPDLVVFDISMPIMSGSPWRRTSRNRHIRRGLSS